MRLYKPMTTCRDTVADWRLFCRVPFAACKIFLIKFHLMRLFFAFFVSVNKKDKFYSFISTYGTVMKRGVLYYRTRIKDANGKLVAIYAKTPEELYDKETLALEQINLYCSRRRTIMYSVEVHNGLYDTKRGRRKMGRDTS